MKNSDGDGEKKLKHFACSIHTIKQLINSTRCCQNDSWRVLVVIHSGGGRWDRIQRHTRFMRGALHPPTPLNIYITKRMYLFSLFFYFIVNYLDNAYSGLWFVLFSFVGERTVITNPAPKSALFLFSRPCSSRSCNPIGFATMFTTSQSVHTLESSCYHRTSHWSSHSPPASGTRQAFVPGTVSPDGTFCWDFLQKLAACVV